VPGMQMEKVPQSGISFLPAKEKFTNVSILKSPVIFTIGTEKMLNSSGF
jgi:hypothetical protein